MWGHIFEALGVGITIVGMGLVVAGAGPFVSMGVATYAVWIGVAGISCTYSSYCH